MNFGRDISIKTKQICGMLIDVKFNVRISRRRFFITWKKKVFKKYKQTAGQIGNDILANKWTAGASKYMKLSTDFPRGGATKNRSAEQI